MKRFYLSVMLAVLSCIVCTNALAYDFVADGIYYNITSAEDLTVEVTYGKEKPEDNRDDYNGTVTIPSSVTYNAVTYNVSSIGDSAFYRCYYIECVIVAEGITAIGKSAFQSCFDMKSISLPQSVTYMGDHVFRDCQRMESITLPDGITSIGENAFNCNYSLTSFIIPNGVVSIGKSAFFCCRGIASLFVPESVTSIGDNAFYQMRHIIYYGDATNKTWGAVYRNGIIDGDYVYSDEEKTQLRAYIGSGGDVTIPAQVELLGRESFGYCLNLTSVIIPEGVTYINPGVFSGCEELTSVTIPESVKGIGDHAFFCCGKLTTINLPSALTSIQYYAFYGCYLLNNLVVPETVTKIGEYAFDGMKNVIYSGSATGSPWGAKYINAQPDEYGFMYADEEKKEITLYLGDFEDVIIPDGVTTVASDAFRYVILKSLTIPESVTKFSSDVSTETLICNCNSIGTTFYYDKSLKTVIFGDAVTNIDERAFLESTSITSVTFGTNVQTIGYRAFEGCSGLTSISLPASVTSIGDYAFRNCTALTAIYLNSLVPPTIGYNTFSGVDKSQCTLYVPEGFESKYKSANYWKDFTNIAINPYVTVEKKAVIYMVDGEEYHRDSVAVTADIAAIDAPTREGYTFSGWSEIPATMPDNDVTVTGTFAVNKHNIVYMVDGTEYQTVADVEYGTTLTAISAPTREGYTFSGWSEIPATMPDNDVTVTGTFAVNKYAVIYMVDDVEYRRDSVEYGATITLAENPTRESHDFSGWSGYPETLVMPASDVVVTGAFQFNGLAGVAAPTTGDEYFDLTGKPLAQPQRGINLVRKADGTTRKIIVK